MGVKLREKPLKRGGVSFYLDISHGGKRWYQFLDIKTRAARSSSEFKEQHRMAKEARRVKENQLSSLKNDLPDNSKQFEDFFDFVLERSKNLRVNRVYKSMIKNIQQYCGKERLPMHDITKQFLIGFQEFLKTRKPRGKEKKKMAANSIYFTVHRFSTFINKAVEEGYMEYNPYNKIGKQQRVKRKRNTPDFLTIDQIATLSQHGEGIPDQFKLAFFFSCFTGLRWSDCTRLRWTQIVKHKMEGNDVDVLRLDQMKTAHKTYLPLSEQALLILSARRTAEDKNATYVFPEFYEPDGERSKQSSGQWWMKKWKRQSGLERLYFHLSRHTFATMTLAEGADLFTVSKLLGHTNISQTMVYAHVVDKVKLAAVSRLPRLPDNYLGGSAKG